MSQYNPDASNIKQSSLDAFVQSDIVAELTSVPGIGPANKELLEFADDQDSGCVTTWQLIGKYLSLKTEDFNADDLKNAFYFYLQQKGVKAGRNTIVLAISEKVDSMMPGIHGGTRLETLDENADNQIADENDNGAKWQKTSGKWWGIY